MSDFSPVSLPGTASHILNCARVPDRLRIDVGLPVEYDGTSRTYPVVYLTDSYWFFPLLRSALHALEVAGEAPPLILVGIGYAPLGLLRIEEEERFRNLRCRDLTPVRDDSNWWIQAGSTTPIGVGVETGHAEDFIEVIQNDVKPFVGRHWRADPRDESLVGFSLGGLFALHVMFTQTQLFRRYVAGSPSLWWAGGALFDLEQGYAQRNHDLQTSLFLSMGSLEEAGGAAACKMVSNLKRLTDRLASRKYPSLKWESAILENETHATGIAPAFVKGLRAVFRDHPAHTQ
jgi:predicted alpha/beta superfamily hydrolase